MEDYRYVYTGSKPAERLAEAGFDVELRKGERCAPVRRPDGRVVRSTDAGVANALVDFEYGGRETVSPRRLRLLRKCRKTFLVACSKGKREGTHMAADLYTGDLFQKSRAYVEERRTISSRWFILSAKHGALPPHEPLTSYDRALRDCSAAERRAWASELAEQLLRWTTRRNYFVVLAGRLYREHLLPKLRAAGHPCSLPLAGMGIGEQKRWLLDHTNGTDR